MELDTMKSLQPAFRDMLQAQAETKQDELRRLRVNLRRIQLEIAETEAYINSLNSLLQAEGLSTIKLNGKNKGGFGVPGNRSKNMPERKPEWEASTQSNWF
jgi:hypothetical protein